MADGGKAVALTVIFGLVLAFYPVVSIAAIAVIPIPAAYVTARHGVAAGVAVGVLAGLICLLFEPLSGLLTCLLALIAGVGAGIALKRGISQSRLMQVLVGLFFLAFAAWAACSGFPDLTMMVMMLVPSLVEVATMSFKRSMTEMYL